MLPHDDTTTVVVAEASVTERSAFPDGRPKTFTVAYQHDADRNELGRLLFSLPVEMLNEETLQDFASSYESDLDSARSDISAVREGLTRAMARLDRFEREQKGN